jgi:hypothetical protein
MSRRSPPKVRRFPERKQRILDELLEKNSEGRITPSEQTKLQELVAEAEKLMVQNARRLADFGQSEGERAPEGAVPVTVWVKAQAARP